MRKSFVAFIRFEHLKLFYFTCIFIPPYMNIYSNKILQMSSVVRSGLLLLSSSLSLSYVKSKTICGKAAEYFDLIMKFHPSSMHASARTCKFCYLSHVREILLNNWVLHHLVSILGSCMVWLYGFMQCMSHRSESLAIHLTAVLHVTYYN